MCIINEEISHYPSWDEITNNFQSDSLESFPTDDSPVIFVSITISNMNIQRNLILSRDKISIFVFSYFVPEKLWSKLFFQIHWKVVFIFFAYFDCAQVCREGRSRGMLCYVFVSIFHSITSSQSCFLTRKKNLTNKEVGEGKMLNFHWKQMSNWISSYWTKPLEGRCRRWKNKFGNIGADSCSVDVRFTPSVIILWFLNIKKMIEGRKNTIIARL